MDEAFLPLHNDLVYELEQAGFSSKSDFEPDVLVGEVADQGESWPVEISLKPPYPEGPPAVVLTGVGKQRGWHENPDGSMCLYPNTPSTKFPWLARGELVGSVVDWCRQKEDGWKQDAPDLDLHRYWPGSGRYDLLIHSPLEKGCSGWKRLDLIRGTKTLSVNGSQVPPRNRARSHRHLYALVRDIGDLALPVTSWGAMQVLLPDPAEVNALVERGRADLVLLRYCRGTHIGVLALEPGVVPIRKKIAWSSVETAEDSTVVVDLRRGPFLADLKLKGVVVVGVGAVGSFVAQALERAGVGHLTLVDFETLRPGNMARHAANPKYIGWNKAVAMARTLGNEAQRVDAIKVRVGSADAARGIVEGHDLIVDATASETVTQLLLLTAQGRPVVSAYLKNQGRSKVVEVLNSITGSRAEPSRMTPVGVDGYESGCGDPVSPTPLYAVQEVAAMTARMVVDLLLGRSGVATEVRETQ